MVSFNGAQDQQNIVQGDFNIQTELKVFIDMGHDTMKAARISHNDFESMLNHFELPTVLAPDLVDMQKNLMEKYKFEYARKVNTSFMFFRENIKQLTERVI